MSDLLTLLAKRAIAPPAVRPRQASRFEPDGAAVTSSVVNLTESDESQQTQSPTQVQQPHRLPPAAVPNSGLQQTTEPAPQPTTAKQAAESLHLSNTLTPAVTPVVAAALPPAARHLGQDIQLKAPVSPLLSANADPAVTMPVMVAPPAVSQVGVSQERALLKERQPLPTATADASQPPQWLAPKVAPLPLVEPHQVRAPVEGRSAEGGKESRGQANEAATSVERHIEITIGRIEIVAAPAPVAAPLVTNNQQQPVESLDAYLRSRDRSQRGGRS